MSDTFNHALDAYEQAEYEDYYEQPLSLAERIRWAKAHPHEYAAIVFKHYAEDTEDTEDEV